MLINESKNESIDSIIPGDKLVFIPIGGCNEIGMNVNLYHYKEQLIMVDCGAGFPDEFTPGANMLVTDLSFINSSKKKLLGLILTHAHEDHLGGVQYLLQDLNCPIYATNFTANFLKIRLGEHDPDSNPDIRIIKQGSKFDLGPFQIEMLHLTHSAPEMQALMIRTEVGNILHTGDWKFDNNPIIGNTSNIDLIKKYGDEGITALMCDSTNVFHGGTSGSEGDLQTSLVDIIKNVSGLIIATTFASNLARLHSLMVAAQHTDRKVIFAGKSLLRMMLAAQDSGYLLDFKDQIIDVRDINKYQRNKLMIISTGCQGEPLAAVNKIAFGSHQYIKLQEGDTVIFSSKIIPGNEKRIFRLFNKLIRSNIKVITEKDQFVHVSGHPSVDELKAMYKLARPQICVPIHGEPIHIHEQARLAKECGIPHTVELENGSILQIDKSGPKILGKMPVRYLAVEGNFLIPTNSNIFTTRSKMQISGVVIATLIFNHKNILAMDPILSLPGCLDNDMQNQNDADYEIYRLLQKEIAQVVSVSAGSGKHGFKRNKIIAVVKSCIRRIIKSEINKIPLVMVNVEKIPSNYRV